MFKRKTQVVPHDAEQDFPAPPRRYSPRLFQILTAVLVIVAVVLFTEGSRNQNGFPEHMDRAYLTDAVISSAPIGQEIFPLVLGKKQTYRIVSATEKQQIVNKIAEVKQQKGGTLALMQTLTKAEGETKLVGTRIYAVTSQGLALVALNGARANPPLPLLRFPVTPNSTVSWQGTFRTGKTTLSGAAVVRVSGPDTLTLNKKTLAAYRLDMAIVTKTNEKPQRQVTTLWLTPSVGMVREQSFPNGYSFLCELEMP